MIYDYLWGHFRTDKDTISDQTQAAINWAYVFHKTYGRKVNVTDYGEIFSIVVK